MNLNATLLLQASNFIITFFIIKRLLIKPCLVVLGSDTKIRQALTHEAEILEQRHTDLAIKREEYWKTARYKFQHMQPPPKKSSDYIIQHISPPIPDLSFSAKEQLIFVDQCARTIVTFVENKK